MLIKIESLNIANEFLKQKFLVNENILGIIENMPNAEVFVDDLEHPTGVLVCKDDYFHLVYTENDEFIDNISANFFHEGFFGFSGIEGKLAEKIRQRYLLGWESRCTLYYMPKENLDLSLKKNPTEQIRLEDAETVDRFYQHRGPGTLEVIKRDITKRPSSAVYVNGEIACWVLIHDDNAMGIMYTKEEYRRKGYAVDVTIDLAQQVIEAGKIPFIQIIQGNSMSPGLAKKCGFIEAGKADWFGIIAGNPKELTEANDYSRQQFLAAIPSDLHPLIYKRNEKYIGLYYFLHNAQYQTPAQDDRLFVKVESEQQKEAWCQLVSQSYNGKFDKSVVEDPNFNLFLIYKDYVAIAASATHKFEEEDRGLYLMSFLSGYKNTELFRLLIMETLNYEKKNGCYFMVTQAEEKYRDVYEELGFRKSHNI
jgi:GNAT superfamily N-acetyltransferase